MQRGPKYALLLSEGSESQTDREQLVSSLTMHCQSLYVGCFFKTLKKDLSLHLEKNKNTAVYIYSVKYSAAMVPVVVNCPGVQQKTHNLYQSLCGMFC